MFTVVSYYSAGTQYEHEAARLVASLERADVPHVVVPREVEGDWYGRTAYKAAFMREMVEGIDGPVLWTDADSVFHRDPRAELAWLDQYDHAAHISFRGEYLSGTMFFNDSPAAYELVRRWDNYVRISRRQGDRKGGGQKKLAYVVQAMRDEGKLAFCNLPAEYCWICDTFPRQHPDREPVIEHLQASRENREPDRPWTGGHGDRVKRRHQRAANLEAELGLEREET